MSDQSNKTNSKGHSVSDEPKKSKSKFQFVKGHSVSDKPKKSKSKFQIVKGQWSDMEDSILITQVALHGPKKWSVIAQSLPGRVGKQCRERWFNHLDPSVTKTPWTEQEDLLIYQGHEDYGNQWSVITKLLPGNRPPNAIKNRWNSTLKRRDSKFNNRKHERSEDEEEEEGDISDNESSPLCIHVDPVVKKTKFDIPETPIIQIVEEVKFNQDEILEEIELPSMNLPSPSDGHLSCFSEDEEDTFSPQYESNEDEEPVDKIFSKQQHHHVTSDLMESSDEDEVLHSVPVCEKKLQDDIPTLRGDKMDESELFKLREACLESLILNEKPHHEYRAYDSLLRISHYPLRVEKCK